MKLLLTSSGLSNKEISEEFLKLVNKPVSEIKIILIPTAAVKEPKEYIEYEKNKITSIGIKKNNLKILELDHKIIYKEISDFDVLYVCGGNTFYLLHKIKESGFDKLIKQFVKNGGVYFGVSAGSYITSPTIEAATWKPRDRNYIGLKDLTALNLVKFLITAHFESKYEIVLRKSINNSKYPVKILTDDQAILVNDNEVKLIGKGEEIKL